MRLAYRLVPAALLFASFAAARAQNAAPTIIS
jgi:hypothetical protein